MKNHIITNQRWKRSTPEERVPNAAFSGPSPPNPLLQPRPPISKPKSHKDPSKLIHRLLEWREPKKEQSSANPVKFEHRQFKRSTPEERVPNPGFPPIFPNNPTIRPYPPLYQPKPPLKLIRIKHKPWEIGRPEEESPNFPFPETSTTNPLILPEPPEQPVGVTHNSWDIFDPKENMLQPISPEPSTANPLLDEESSEVPIKVTNQVWKRSRPEERVPNYSFPGLSTIRPIIIKKPIQKPNFRKYNNKFLIHSYSRREFLELRNLEENHPNFPKKELVLRPHILQESLSRWDTIAMIIMLSTIFLAVFFIVFYQRLNRQHRVKRTLLGEF